MAKWTEPNAMPLVPAAMLAELSRRDERLGETQQEPLYATIAEYEPDEHTTDPGVGAADMECVFHLHVAEEDEDAD